MGQPLTGFERELAAENAGNRSGTSCTYRLLRGPQSLGLVVSFDEREARRIEAEVGEAVAVWRTTARELTGRENEKQRAVPRRAGEKAHEETECGGEIGFACGGNLMDGAKGEAVLRKIGVECREAERQAGILLLRNAFHAGEHPP